MSWTGKVIEYLNMGMSEQDAYAKVAAERVAAEAAEAKAFEDLKDSEREAIGQTAFTFCHIDGEAA